MSHSIRSHRGKKKKGTYYLCVVSVEPPLRPLGIRQRMRKARKGEKAVSASKGRDHICAHVCEVCIECIVLCLGL